MNIPRILIAEDEALIAEEIRDHLEAIGLKVVDAVATSEEAIALVESRHPDLVLLDIHLKGKLDGIEAAARMKQRFDTPHLYLTAHSDDATIRRAKRPARSATSSSRSASASSASPSRWPCTKPSWSGACARARSTSPPRSPASATPSSPPTATGW